MGFRDAEAKVREAVAAVAKLCSESPLSFDPDLTRWHELGDSTKIAHWREAERVLREHWREAPSTDLRKVQDVCLKLRDVVQEVSGGRSGDMLLPELRTCLVHHTILAVRQLVWARTEPTASHADRGKARMMAHSIAEDVLRLVPFARVKEGQIRPPRRKKGSPRGGK